MRTERCYFVYMMTCASRRALYTGVTNSLRRRVAEHKSGECSGFTARYRTDPLVYVERFQDIRNALKREKQLKRWRREKKDALVMSMNPTWKDLSSDWGKPIELLTSTRGTPQPQAPSTRCARSG